VHQGRATTNQEIIFKKDQAFSTNKDSKKEKEEPHKKLAKHFHTFALVRLNVSNAWVEDT